MTVSCEWKCIYYEAEIKAVNRMFGDTHTRTWNACVESGKSPTVDAHQHQNKQGLMYM